MPQGKLLVATVIIGLDFGPFIGARVEKRKGWQRLKQSALSLPGRFVSVRVGPLCLGSNLSRPHGPVVDPDVVDQAGEETARFHSLTGTDIQASARVFQTGLCISGDFKIIDVQYTV